MLFVGIDIAKRNHEASVIAQDGSVVRKAMRFANSQAGYNKFMDMVRSLKEPVVFGMEATGHYWLTLYTHLRNDGFTVHVINPIQSDALRGMYIRKTKTDSVDSVIIADVIRFGRYCETSVEPGDLQAMRELCRQRFYIIDMASDLKRKVIALLDQVFLRIPLEPLPWKSCPSTPRRKKCCLFPRSSLPRYWRRPVAAGWARKKPLKSRTQPEILSAL